MGINDLEFLKQIYENLKNGTVLNANTDPTLVWGLVLLGMYVGVFMHFGKGIKDMCRDDGKQFIVMNANRRPDKDPTDKRIVHKFVASGYLDKKRTQ